ncbi:hypothetical protein [Azospirillum endophyticum]
MRRYWEDAGRRSPGSACRGRFEKAVAGSGISCRLPIAVRKRLIARHPDQISFARPDILDRNTRRRSTRPVFDRSAIFQCRISKRESLIIGALSGVLK